MRALRKLRRESPSDAYVFVSERGGPMSPIGFHRLVHRLGEAGGMPFPIHPHMLRMRAVTSSPMTVTTREPFSIILAIGIFNIPLGIRKWLRIASEILALESMLRLIRLSGMPYTCRAVECGSCRLFVERHNNLKHMLGEQMDVTS
jgi:hypothetical protein